MKKHASRKIENSICRVIYYKRKSLNQIDNIVIFYCYASFYCSGAVAQDGRIEPGDMILEVNGVSFEDMSNDDAVRALREAVQKPGYGKSE